VVGATPRGRPDVGHPESGQPPGVAPTGMDDNPVGATPRGRPPDHPATDVVTVPPTLGQIVGWFKTMTTNAYIRGVKEHAWPPFPGKLWQRNYYEHVIRNLDALDRIRAYIQTNPERWAWDRENPARSGLDPVEAWIYRGPR
jgi:putative transposase